MKDQKVQPITIVTYPDGRLDNKNVALYLELQEKILAMMRTSDTGPQFIKRG